MPRKKTDYAPQSPPEDARICEEPGCPEPGYYKAPKSREALHDYRWFCLDHIREHNQKWNYFEGLEADEIEHFMKDAVTGHRPTWEREALMRDQYRKLQDAVYEFLAASHKKVPNAPPVNGKIRKAITTLDVPYPFTEQELKSQYRMLVKKHHPDLNQGDKASEELFKRVAVAYQVLLEHLKDVR